MKSVDKKEKSFLLKVHALKLNLKKRKKFKEKYIQKNRTLFKTKCNIGIQHIHFANYGII